jgi:phenylacetate-CoA ligase
MHHPLEKLYWTGFTAWHGRRESSFPFAPREEQLRVQNRRVRSIVAFAYETVPFYREFMKRRRLRPSDFRTASDLGQLPLLSGEDLSDNPGRFDSTAISNDRTLEMDTSGSTGLYKKVRHDCRALFLARAGGHRARQVLSHFTGRSLGYREVRVTRRGGTGPVVLAFYRDHSWVPSGVGLQRAMAYCDDSFGDNIRVINETKPEVLGGFGSYIGGIYRYAWMHDIPIHRPKVISYGGDALLSPDRRIIEDEYRIPVISRYQACEALNIAWQCERGEGFHISTDQVALRIVDASGNTQAPGTTGEVVISNLINRGTILLNYRLGDLAQLSSNACRCGRTLPSLLQLDGRTEDLILLHGGEAVHESELLSTLYAVPGAMQIQVTQYSLAKFLIRVVVSGDPETVRAGIAAAFLPLIGNPERVELEVIASDVIPQDKNGKFRSVICHWNREIVC